MSNIYIKVIIAVFSIITLTLWLYTAREFFISGIKEPEYLYDIVHPVIPYLSFAIIATSILIAMCCNCIKKNRRLNMAMKIINGPDKMV